MLNQWTCVTMLSGYMILWYHCDIIISLINLGGKILRPSEINTDIVTWSRLLNRAAPAICAGVDTASPLGASAAKSTPNAHSNLKPNALNFDSDSSPPQSDTQSGENSPKTPDTPNSRRESESSVFDKSDDEITGSQISLTETHNGTLPPLEPVSDADLMHTPDQIILPPPPQFQLDDKESSRSSSKHKKDSKSSSKSTDERNVFSNGTDITVEREAGKTTGRPPSPLPELVKFSVCSFIHMSSYYRPKISHTCLT